MTVRDRLRGALVEALVAVVMLVGGVALRTQAAGFLALLGLLLVLMAAMGLADALLFATGRIAGPDGSGETSEREREGRQWRR